jgi:membrane associated rhomboid family serine protease
MFIAGSSYLLDSIMGGQLSKLFALNPELVINKMELWRLFTFPFAFGSIEGALLFGFTFYIFAPKLEDIFHRYLYPFLLFLILTFQGIVLTLAFWKMPVTFSGMEGVTFFVIAMFTLLHLRKKISFLYLKPLSTIIFLMIVSAIWLSLISIHALVMNSYMYFANGAYSAIYGFTCGFIMYLQIKYSKSNIQNIKKYKHPIIDIPKPEELSLAVIANKEMKYLNNKLNDDFFDSKSGSLFSEDKLNEILDKINAQGKESLTTLELKFLEDYSNNL